ncbi:MAG: hypothetical protein WAT79_00530 [Saprospiraceae bacterium]
MHQKIIIIDDDKYNQMKLNYYTDITVLIQEKYGDLIRYMKHVEEKDLKNMESANIIMIHDSFPDTEMKDRVVFMARAKHIHLIRFTNGITTTFRENVNGIENIELKKDRVYNNLDYFMKDLMQTSTLDLSKLIHGENYALVKATLIRENLSKTLLIRYGQRVDQLIPMYSKEEKDLTELYYLAYGENHQHQFNKLIENSTGGYEEIMEACNSMVSIIKSNI